MRGHASEIEIAHVEIPISNYLFQYSGNGGSHVLVIDFDTKKVF